MVYTLAPYWARGSSVGSTLGQHQTTPPFLLATNRLHPGRGTTTNGLVPKNLLKQILIKQSSARSLRDCISVVFHARQALLANHADQTLSTEHWRLATDLISNCSIASNALLSSVPLISLPCIRIEAESQHTHLAGTCLCIKPNQKE